MLFQQKKFIIFFLLMRYLPKPPSTKLANILGQRDKVNTHTKDTLQAVVPRGRVEGTLSAIKTIFGGAFLKLYTILCLFENQN